MKYVIIGISNEKYGILIDLVQSIERMQPIRSIPLTSKRIRGEDNLRGQIITVLDLRQMLYLY